MEKQQTTPEDIYEIAQKTATYFLIKEGLNEKHHLIEDATQEIALAGFQNWEETKNIKFVCKRMQDRLKSWWGRYCERESKQPKPLSTLPKFEDDSGDEITEYDQKRRERRVEPDQEEEVRHFIETQLTPRQRQIADFSIAGYTTDEIAQELSVSSRTVQRERGLMEAKYNKEYHTRKK